MVRNHTIIEYKWKCELCSQEGRDWLPRWKAMRSYRKHFNRVHSGIGVQPILRKKYIGGGIDAKYNGRFGKESKKIR